MDQPERLNQLIARFKSDLLENFSAATDLLLNEDEIRQKLEHQLEMITQLVDVELEKADTAFKSYIANEIKKRLAAFKQQLLEAALASPKFGDIAMMIEESQANFINELEQSIHNLSPECLKVTLERLKLELQEKIDWAITQSIPLDKLRITVSDHNQTASSSVYCCERCGDVLIQWQVTECLEVDSDTLARWGLYSDQKVTEIRCVACPDKKTVLAIIVTDYGLPYLASWKKNKREEWSLKSLSLLPLDLAVFNESLSAEISFPFGAKHALIVRSDSGSGKIAYWIFRAEQGTWRLCYSDDAYNFCVVINRNKILTMFDNDHLAVIDITDVITTAPITGRSTLQELLPLTEIGISTTPIDPLFAIGCFVLDKRTVVLQLGRRFYALDCNDFIADLIFNLDSIESSSPILDIHVYTYNQQPGLLIHCYSDPMKKNCFWFLHQNDAGRWGCVEIDSLSELGAENPLPSLKTANPKFFKLKKSDLDLIYFNRVLFVCTRTDQKSPHRPLLTERLSADWYLCPLSDNEIVVGKEDCIEIRELTGDCCSCCRKRSERLAL